MLTPPFDPSVKIPFDNSHKGGQTTTVTPGQKSRTPSLASAASSASTVTRKPAPPVPKKPMLLSKPNSREASISSIDGSSVLARRSTLASREKTVILPPPPRRNTGTISMPESNKKFPASQPTGNRHQQKGSPSDENDGPRLPPRRATGDLSGSNGLMDEDDDGARAIPSLQPLRRQ